MSTISSGSLMETLRTCGLADDTIVMLTSDHGDFLGERGLWYKMSFREHAARVPLIVHAPGRFAPRARVDAVLASRTCCRRSWTW